MDFKSFTKQKILTLVFLKKNNEILLGLKKRGFGKGKWNGFGGKVEKGETISESAMRELHEECGLIPTSLKFIGFITFKFEIEELPLQVHVFTSDTYEGELMESEEMKPQWFDQRNLPYNEMWIDDRYWYPLMFENKTFYGNFMFRGYEELLDFSLKEISNDDMLKLHKEIVNYPLYNI